MKTCSLCSPARFLILLLALLGFPALYAQQDDAAAPQPPEEEAFDEESFLDDTDLIILPDFEVVTADDRGYRAANTVSGTSLNISLRDVPQSISVINQEFLEDQQATDLTEALAYEAGVSTESFSLTGGANALTSGNFLPSDSSPSSVASAGAFGTNSISIRGFVVPNQQRFGFRIGNIFVGRSSAIVLGGNTDTSNYRRVEVVRGPASLLYGLNVLSGVVNIIPKEPIFDGFRAEASIGFGNEDYFRTTLDLTGPLLEDQLAYRLIFAYQEGGEDDAWIDHSTSEGRFFTGQLKYRPFKDNKLELIFETQLAEQERNGVGFSHFTASTGGNSELFRNKWDEPIDYGLEFGPEEAAFFGHVPKADPPDSVSDENDNYVFDRFGHDYRISGPDTEFKRDEFTVLGVLRWIPLENLSFELGSYYSDITVEERQVAGAVFSNSDSATNPGNITISVPEGRDALAADNRFRPDNGFIRNPELGLIQRDDFATISGQQSFFNEGDIQIGFGPGELFRIPNLQIISDQRGEFANLRNAYGLDDSKDIIELRDNDPTTYEQFLTDARSILAGSVPPIQDNRQFARYYWYESEESGESLQLRFRGNYGFETDFWGIDGKHTVSLGVSYIEDSISLLSTGAPGPASAYTDPFGGERNLSDDDEVLRQRLLRDDAYQLRESVFDTSIIRYNNERFAITGPTGAAATGGLAGIADDGKVSVYRSGFIDSEVTYESYYGIYQGRFFDEKLTFIGGIRNDSYSVHETEFLRAVIDEDFFLDLDDKEAFLDHLDDNGVNYGGSVGVILTDVLIGDGSGTYTPDPRLPDSLNSEIQADFDALRTNGFTGTSQDLFDEDPDFTTGTAGLTYKIIDELSLQLVFSQGVFPNTGQVDGNNDPIDAEQTESYEVGFKFDFFDSKISGRISYYHIKRENGVFFWDSAPKPSQWLGAEDFQVNQERIAFDPQAAQFNSMGAERPSTLGVTQAVRSFYLRRALEDFAGDEGPWATEISPELKQDIQAALDEDTTSPPNTIAFSSLYTSLGVGDELGGRGDQGPRVGEIVRNVEGIPGRPTAGNVPLVLVLINGEEGLLNNPNNREVDGVEVGNVLKHALDLAINDRTAETEPFLWDTVGGQESENINNASNTTGSNITYEEEVNGIDGQVFLSPTDNYQIVFNFSWQDRQISGNGLNLVSVVDPNTGENLGTPYDEWVWILGSENFTDPSDPTTYTGAGSVGADLSGAPAFEFSIWNKYAFSEGPLEGLEIAGGVRYTGEAVTSVAIGGEDFSLNRFPTPKSEPQYRVDLSLNYRFELYDIDWRFGFKVDNLLNDQIWQSEAEYYDEVTDRTIFRRHIDINPPRSYRMTLTATF